LGLGASLLGLIILSGLNFSSLKMALIIAFLWMASPVASHLISRLEVVTNEHLAEHCGLPKEKWEDELC
jgi:multicomponent Na+:H+ antiporter subunit G